MTPIIVPDAAIRDFEERNRQWLDRIMPQGDNLSDDLPLELRQFLEEMT
jgi:hypothetical protein